MKTIVLTGGGTAGHVMPNLALIPELKKHFNKIIYIGSDTGIEKELLSNYKEIIFFATNPPKFARKLTFKNLTIPFKLMKSIIQTRKFLKKTNPSVVFSKGGFVSIPVAIAAWSLKIPVLTHESDYSLGLANKVIRKFSKLTLTSFEDTCKNKKNTVFTGPPLREQIYKGTPKFVFENSKKTILVLGGSLGAEAINDFIDFYLESLLKTYNILHITGKGKLKNRNMENYLSVEYAKDIEDFYASADFVISRSGANVLFELISLNKASIFIPLPKKESRGDQIDNAKYFAKRDMCEVILQEDLNINNLLKSLKRLEKNEKNIKINIKAFNLRDSNKKIVNLILKNSR